MAEVHRTTMTPTKLELLTTWLPSQPWYDGKAGPPQLSRAGGFRLDDPDGQVGIEFLVVTDSSGPQAAHYLVPLTYRGAPLAGAESALVGTSEHGVLGTRWIYNAPSDPVFVAELLSLLQNVAKPQMQSESFTPDPSVVVVFWRAGPRFPGTMTVNSAVAREISTPCFRSTFSSSACAPGRGSSAASTYAAGPSVFALRIERLLFR